MTWTAPRTWVTSELVTSSIMNTHVRDNLLALGAIPATTLPGSPTNGDWAILTDSLTSPTYQWLFRYDTAVSHAEKWAYIGGVPWLGKYDTGVNTSSTTYADINAAVSFTIPRAGVYRFRFGCVTFGGAASGAYALLSLYKNAIAVDADAISGVQNTSISYGFVKDIGSLTVVVSSVYKLQSRWVGSGGTPVSTDDHWLEITPVRL